MAFYGCSSLPRINIPIGVKSIRNATFMGCSNLVNVNLPSGITSIGDLAFSGCSNLTSIEIPSGVTSIGESAFYGCDSLTEVTIPHGVTSIGQAAFNGCNNLASIILPSSIISFWPDTFFYCTGLTDVYYAGGESEWAAIIIHYPWGDEYLGNVDISTSNVTVHYNYDDSESKTISGVLRSTEAGDILWECSYQVGNDGVPRNGRIDITMNNSNQAGELYLYNGSGAAEFPWELEPYNIPKSAITKVVIMGPLAGPCFRITANSFQGYNKLQTLVLDQVSGIDSYAFEGCTSLEKVSRWDSDEDLAHIGKGAFKNCTSLAEMNFSGVITIGDEAFQNTPLGEIQLHKGITEIGSNAFADCADVLICCYEGSYAHQYAQENNIPFKLIEEISYTPFIMGQDQWSFSNSGEYFTDETIVDGHYSETYFLTDSDYEILTRSLYNTEKEIIDHFKDDRYWSGSCYGMSVVAILSKAGIIDPNDVQGGKDSLYSITKSNNDRVESFINFYHLQQHLTPAMNDCNIFATKNTADQLRTIEEKVGMISATKVPVLLGFSGSKGGHAVVAYGVEHGDFTLNDGFLGTTLGGTKYDSRIVIYDCNYPNGSEYSYLWYNSGTSEWCIPNYSWANKLIIARNQPNIMAREYAQILPHIDQETSTDAPTVWLDYEGNADGYFMEWAGSTLWIDGTTDKREDGLVTYYDVDVLTNETYNPGTLHLTLPNPTTSYSVKPLEDDSNSFTLSFENSVLSMACENAELITFGPDGKIETVGTSGSYTASMVFNDGYHVLPWYKTSIRGTNGGNLSLTQTDEGIIIGGSNLHDILVTVKDNEETRSLRFSTDEKSALLTNEPLGGEQKPIIMLDSNHDGVYDEVAKVSYTITFHANGGTVAPASMMTDDAGKLTSWPTPTRTGYTFNGWFTSVSGGTPLATDTVFTKDTTVYAQWTAVSVNPNPTPGPNNPVGPTNPGSSWNDYTPPTTYLITTPTTPNGTVTVSPKSASKGSTVTITATPDAGYQLTTLTVTDNNGKEVSLTDKGSGAYAFTMPGGKVSINAVFQPIEASWSNPFTDVSTGAWYYDTVKFVSENGLMNGVGNSLFAPEANLSRGMLAQIFYNKEGQPAVAYNGAFMDVKPEAWCFNAVSWASEKGIVDGYGNGLFGPDDNITREQLAVMLWRYAGKPVPPNLLLNFTDANLVSDYAMDAMRWAVDKGIINGKGNGILDPRGYAARAEAAQMLKNYLDK